MAWANISFPLGNSKNLVPSGIFSKRHGMIQYVQDADKPCGSKQVLLSEFKIKVENVLQNQKAEGARDDGKQHDPWGRVAWV